MSLVYWALSGLLSLSVASVASAVIIDSGDGTGNVTAPVPDPGWSYVGTRDVLTAVYLGNGWVLTANHVGAGDVTLGGFVYPYLPGTALQLHNPDWTLADLLLFSIDPYPVMPLLPIATNAAPLGTDLILIGHGLNRGPVTSWDANGPPPPGPIYGYDWAVGWTMRWGTNDIEDYPVAPVLGTWSFASEFDASGSPHEAQGAHGDSGGAAFVFDGFDWVLAGVTFAIGEHPGQPANVSLYGQSTHAADLSVYSDEILYVVGLPEPTGGLAAGLVLLLGLWRRRSRREIQRAA